MLIFGPISSVFDYVTFGLLILVLGVNERAFHTGWFIESLFTRNGAAPSAPSWPVRATVRADDRTDLTRWAGAFRHRRVIGRGE